MDFDRFEEVHDQDLLSVAAADLDGTTGQFFGESSDWEGEILYDLDLILDRDELGILLWAEHLLQAYFASTATADSTIRVGLEVSASPEKGPVNHVTSAGSSDITGLGSSNQDFTIEVDGDREDDTVDVIGRVMNAVGFGPITDGTNGPGGAGTAGWDRWEGRPVAAPSWDARDEVFSNGWIEISNASDLSAHVDYTVHHVYGVVEDFFD